MKAQTRFTILGALLPLAAASCAMPSIKAIPADPDRAQVEPASSRAVQPGWSQEQVAKPRLYARDGSVIGQQAPGTVSVSPDTGQAVGADSGSRWTLLEQYQAAAQANEELEIELRALSSALEQSEAREAQLRAMIEEMRSQYAELTQEHETLGGHNVELASRLTTAQIRRLQSEKLLLEAKLDWKKVESMINTPARTATETTGAPQQPSTTAAPQGTKEQL